jgi:hypothetical protein
VVCQAVERLDARIVIGESGSDQRLSHYRGLLICRKVERQARQSFTP